MRTWRFKTAAGYLILRDQPGDQMELELRSGGGSGHTAIMTRDAAQAFLSILVDFLNGEERPEWDEDQL